MVINEEAKKALYQYQVNEITESIIYSKLAAIEKKQANKDILLRIAADEAKHHDVLEKYTGKKAKPNQWQVVKYYWIARMFGITFGLKLMENGEAAAQNNYAVFFEFPDIKKIAQEEDEHENELINLLDEERLNYMGSVVLGLNDALVEFTGALAGFTLALSDSKLIALTGSITGIAAALSMASSEYLSTKSDKGEHAHALRAAIYTGIAYIFTVATLVAPFVFISNVIVALAVMLGLALLIIALFNYYYSVAKSESFRKRFTEMAILSFSVAGISFLIGYALKTFTGIGD